MMVGKWGGGIRVNTFLVGLTVVNSLLYVFSPLVFWLFLVTWVGSSAPIEVPKSGPKSWDLESRT